MAEQKKPKVNVRDLKPKKDAKGGGRMSTLSSSSLRQANKTSSPSGRAV